MRRPEVLLALAVVFFVAPPAARADWLLGAYTGMAATASNTLTVTPATGSPIAIGDVSYRGQAFRSPIYYGLRLARPRADGGFGVEVEFTHAKAIAIDTRSTELSAFQQSHGLNFVLANVAYRTPARCNGRCAASVRGGLGVATPHVESTFRGAHQEQYQYGGIAWQAGAGVEYRLWGRIYALADARVTRVTEKHLRGAGADISGSFFTRHVDFGIGVRIGGQ